MDMGGSRSSFILENELSSMCFPNEEQPSAPSENGNGTRSNSGLDAEVQGIVADVKLMKDAINKHSAALLNIYKACMKKPPRQIFPISSINQLLEMENLVHTNPKGDIVTYMKAKFDTPELHKVLPEIFDEQLLLKINWKGNHKIHAIRDLVLFRKYFYEAVQHHFETFLDFEHGMRAAFRYCKRALYKKNYKMRKRNSNAP